jgi:hypothetical protein
MKKTRGRKSRATVPLSEVLFYIKILLLSCLVTLFETFFNELALN